MILNFESEVCMSLTNIFNVKLSEKLLKYTAFRG